MIPRTIWFSACIAAVLVVFPAAAASPAEAQQTPQPEHAEASPEAKQAHEFRNLLEGRGMGMARAAEINGYPGPMHVLEHAEALELSEGQLERSREFYNRVKNRAPELGSQIVNAEKRLEAMFADGTVNPGKMNSLLVEIAGLRAQLRSLHLTAHLDQAMVLTEAQIEKYRALRATPPAAGEARRPMRRLRDMKREERAGGNGNPPAR